MREIKFRAWDKENQVLVYSVNEEYLIGYDGVELFISREQYIGEDIEWLIMDDVIFMQYTGLKDNNGKEIYEGDIIEYKDYSGGAIIFGGEQPKSKGVIEIENLFDGVKYLSGIGRQKGPDVEVVGNIYENPELLEV